LGPGNAETAKLTGWTRPVTSEGAGRPLPAAAVESPENSLRLPRRPAMPVERKRCQDPMSVDPRRRTIT
jgi:hypothetical protein